ncbi:unnamed protein product [Ectocarpus sp. 12 AP-2014]
MIDAPGKVSSSLRRVALSRALFRAKNVVRAVHSVTKRLLGPGEAVFRQGERGSSLFTVEEGELNVVKEHSGVHRTVARLSPGSSGTACTSCSRSLEARRPFRTRSCGRSSTEPTRPSQAH